MGGQLAALLAVIRELAPRAMICVASIISFAPTGPFAAFNAQVVAYNAILPFLVDGYIAGGGHAVFVDMAKQSANTCAKAGSCCPGGIHPTVVGYADMAMVWHSVLTQGEIGVTRMPPLINDSARSSDLYAKNIATASTAPKAVGIDSGAVPVKIDDGATPYHRGFRQQLTVPQRPPPVSCPPAKGGVLYVDACGTGFNSVDSIGQPDHTAVIQAALNASDAHTVILRNLSTSRPWITNPLFIYASHRTFHLQSAFVLAKRGVACRQAGQDTCFGGRQTRC
jgi:hypothetical protein